MFRNFHISTKITALVLALTLFSIASISFFTLQINENVRIEESKIVLESVTSANKALADQFLIGIKNALTLVDQAAQLTTIDSLQVEAWRDQLQWQQLSICDKKGTVIRTTDTNLAVGSNLTDAGTELLKASPDQLYLSQVKKLIDGQPYFYAAVASGSDHLLVAKIELIKFFNSLLPARALGETGEVLILNRDPASNKVIIQSPALLDVVSGLKPYDISDARATIARLALEKETGTGLARDYRNKQVMTAWAKTAIGNWLVVTKYDYPNELEGAKKNLREVYVMAGLTVVAFAVLFSMVFSRSLVQPLNQMRNTLEMVAKGILPEKQNNYTSDEFGKMGEKVDELVEVLKANADFAQKVGEGKFDAFLKPASENDTLGLSLINMRNNLIENEQRDKERNWIVRGVAEVGEILRTHDTLEA
jgi:hypothetical protein